MFQQQAESKNQTLSLTEQILYPYVYMDAPHLSEVCLNIISNAIKYTNTGGTISCNVLQESCEKEDWCNCIKDAEEWTDTGNRIKENEKMKKTAIVTGGNRGIGYGIVKQLGLDGYNVAIMSVGNRAEYEDNFKELKKLGIDYIYYQ